MAVTYTNRKRQTYFLHEGKTKTGKAKFFFSKGSEGALSDAIPEGYEIHENPNAQVFLRKKTPQLVTDEEITVVKAAIRQYAAGLNYVVDVKGNEIVIYEGQGGYFHQMLRFTLTDEKTRRFSVERWCFRGSIDDWFPLLGGGELTERGQEMLQAPWPRVVLRVDVISAAQGFVCSTSALPLHLLPPPPAQEVLSPKLCDLLDHRGRLGAEPRPVVRIVSFRVLPRHLVGGEGSAVWIQQGKRPG